MDPVHTEPEAFSTPANTKAQRYSSFDGKAFSSFASGSPAQAKRALEAHLADTDRRIRDTSRLGTSLLEQKKQLADRLRDVETQGTEIEPALRSKLEDLEKEYNELSRESVRALIPKRTTEEETPVQSSRKQRNGGRTEDLAFATEISTSLLGQVRHLQTLVAEKDEALRQAHGENARLLNESEHNGLRLKSLDSNEQRYKDETWLLETQVQELAGQVKDAQAREKRLGATLASLQEAKALAEREGDEMKINYNKLHGNHLALKKQLDSELATFRKDLSSGDSERELLEKKVVELTAHNEEMAHALSYRREDVVEPQEASFVEADEGERSFFDASPPPSPTKGLKQGGLESETLRSSLHHAHKMIQNLKGNMNRERSEKTELRRLLQEARDELESRRADGITANAGKKRKPERKAVRPDKLGNRSGATEEIVNDPTWEEYDSPSAKQDTSDAFETANEQDTSDAFETAESNAGDSGDETETEIKRPIVKRSSLRSTASDDTDTPSQPRFKLKLGQRMKRLVGRDSKTFDSPASFTTTSSVGTPKGDLAAELGNIDDSITSTPSRTMSTFASPDRRETVVYAPVMVEAGTMTDEVEPELLPEPLHSPLPEPLHSQPVFLPVAAAAAVGVAGAAGVAALSHESDTDISKERKDMEDLTSKDLSTEDQSEHSIGSPLETTESKETVLQETPPKRSDTVRKSAGWSFANVFSRSTEPVEEPSVKAPLSFSSISSQSTTPVKPYVETRRSLDDNRAPFQAVSGNFGSVSPRNNKRDGQILDDPFYFPNPPKGKEPAIDQRKASPALRRNPSASVIGAPPLPLDHKEVIAAASRTSSLVNQQPPTFSPRSYRPRTPSGSVRQSSPSRASITTARRAPSVRDREAPITRRSSISSFASEMDERFNRNYVDYDPQTTDPRMIQAITQTMIGEYMWKYTRKTGRGELSEKRHLRFFWIHPYTRTLYWSTKDPGRAGGSEHKAKSVPIQAVRVVSDENRSPPGLYSKSIVVVTPSRSIKFTAPVSGRHDTWFNALSYLLQRHDAPAPVGRSVAGSVRGAPSIAPSMRAGSMRRSNLGSPIQESALEHHPKLSTNLRDLRAPVKRTSSIFGQSSTSVQTARQDYEIDRDGFKKPARPSSIRGSLASRSRAAMNVFKSERDEDSPSLSSQTASTADAHSITSTSTTDGAPAPQVHRHHHSNTMENVRACCDGTFLIDSTDSGKHDVGSLGHRHSLRNVGASNYR